MAFNGVFDNWACWFLYLWKNSDTSLVVLVMHFFWKIDLSRETVSSESYYLILFIPSFSDHPKYLDEFTYQDSDINGIILSCMNNLSLVGVSGRIFYGGNAAPDSTDIQIERIQGIILANQHLTNYTRHTQLLVSSHIHAASTSFFQCCSLSLDRHLS